MAPIFTFSEDDLYREVLESTDDEFQADPKPNSDIFELKPGWDPHTEIVVVAPSCRRNSQKKYLTGKFGSTNY